jgi:hypothetical protein
MFRFIRYWLRKTNEWTAAVAIVESTEQHRRTLGVYFTYEAGRSTQYGWLNVDRSSSLYGLNKGDQFTLLFDPNDPERFYCAQAVTLRVLYVWTAFVIFMGYVAKIALKKLLSY